MKKVAFLHLFHSKPAIIMMFLATWSDWGAWSGCVEENDNSAIRRTRACTIYNATSGEWEESSDAVGHRYCRDGDHVEAVACYEDVCPAQ